MKNNRTRKLSQRVRYALIAGMAGAFLVPQAAFAAPTGGEAVFGGATGLTTSSDMNITSSSPNNVITWKDYSIAQGERVRYDSGAKTNNYLNIVTGANTSNINGKIEGGNNIYIVNPNGVIFGKSAEVNVGNLYVSTQDGVSSTALTNFKTSGTSPLDASAALKSDVVNMGKIAATTVEVHGAHVRFLNAADVTTTLGGTTLSPVTVYTAAAATAATDPDGGYAHIGYRTAAAPTNYTVHTTGVNAEYYQLVANKAELDAINANSTNLSGKYMLEQDIDLGGAEHTPIGGNTHTAFKGKLDGNFFRVKNFKVTDSTLSRSGLFGELDGARIENLGVTDATITGSTGSGTETAGGIAGSSSNNTVLKNVYVARTTVNGNDGYHGGLVGYTTNTVIDSSFSKATIGEGGGVIGYSASGTTVTNTYSDVSMLTGASGTYFIYYINPAAGTTVKNSYATGNFSYSTSVPSVTNTYIVTGGKAKIFNASDEKDAYASSTYSAWGSDINNDGTPGAKWRIYEGRTLPLLTAFMSGTATATYNYRYFNADKSVTDTTSSDAVRSNNGADVTGLTYNSKYVKLVGTPTTSVGNKSNVIYTSNADQSKIHDYDASTDVQDFDKKHGIRNAGTKAILWSDQDGPNLRGVNVTIAPREVKLDGGDLGATRMYNGKKSVKDAFIKALTSGSVKTSGFTKEDIDAGTVALDTTNFTAEMADKNVVRNPDGTFGKKNVTFGGTLGFDKTKEDSKNYTFDGSSISTLTGQVTITPAPLYLTITKKKAADKIYDGTDAVKDDEMKQSVSPPNIKLNDTITDGSSDGTLMRDDSGQVDTVLMKSINDPTYTDEHGVSQIHVGSHKLQYTNVGLDTTTHSDGQNYDLYYTTQGGAKTKVESEKLYLDGDIIRRQITRDSFNVYNKTTHAPVTAQKVYNRNDEYTPDADVYLSTNASASGNTGIVSRDQGHITFALTDGKGYFTDNTGIRTKNVKTATKIAYEVTGQSDSHTDTYGGHLLSDYYVLDTDNTTKKALSDTFHAMGAGKITPKTITAAVRENPLTKVYDALTSHTKKGDQIITLSGIVSGDSVTNESTAAYDNKNVGTGKTVTYTAKFSTNNADEAQNYTFAPQAANPAQTPVTLTKTLTGLGTITKRPVSLVFKSADKIYDGTTTNTKIAVDSYNDGENGDVIRRDFGASGPTLPGTVTSSYDTRHAGTGKTVTYTGLANALGGNYEVVDTQTGTGTIQRRLILSSGFQVRKSDGTTADAEKVYDGTSTFTMQGGETLVAKTAASGSDTGVVEADKNNIYFDLAGDAHFLKGATGSSRTSHVSEAERVGYSVKAQTRNGTDSPLTNYEFGTTVSKRYLETVDGTHAEDAVTAAGKITPRQLAATTKYIEKIYDGMAEHTDGNRRILYGKDKDNNNIVGLNLIADATGQPTNTSTARYADKNVARDGSGNVIKKSVTYTAQLTGKYADDYEIVDAGNNVISTVSGTGDSKTVTAANFKTDAAGGKITPRKLKATMGAVEKTYDDSAKNTTSNITGFTDDPASSVLGTILSGDGISAGSLQTTYNNMLTASPATASSSYGRGTGSAFTADPNASNGTPHDVKYTNLDRAFKNVFASHEQNYEMESTAYGKGTIKRFEINNSNVTFTMKRATKIYDGDRTVKYNESADPSAVKNYVDTATLQLNGKTMDIKGSISAGSGTYDTTPNVNGGAQQGVTYELTYTGSNSNITIASGTKLHAAGVGVITPKTVTATVKGPLKKIYDGTTTAMNLAADAQGSVVTKGEHIVDINGLVAGSKNESTAVFTSKDAGEGNRTVHYTVGIDAAHADNYRLVDENGHTITAPIETHNNTITRRHVALTYAPVQKDYDATPDNTSIGAPTVSSADAAVLARDRSTLISGGAVTGLTGITSQYGTGTGVAFAADKNAGDKSVRYQNTGAAMRAALGSDAGNYLFDEHTYSTGKINKAHINASDVTFEAHKANKVYDGDRNVLWKDGAGVYHSDAASLKNYVKKATAVINGKTVDLKEDLTLQPAQTQYDNKNATNGTEQNVAYSFTLNNNNIEVAGGNSFTKTGKGTIERRVLTVGLTDKTGIDKDYDRTADLVDTAARKYTKFTDDDARGNVTYASGTTNDHKLVRTANGAGVNDGAQMTIAAQYADRNVARDTDGKPTAQDISYTVSIAAANGGTNYQLSDGTTTVNAETGLTTLKAKGTIQPRKLQLNFKNPAPRPYDTTAENKEITLQPGNEVTALGTNVGATMLADDGIVPSAFTLTGVRSSYGTGSTKDTFRENPNAGNRTVEFRNLAGTLAASKRNNYEVVDTSYGTGKITKTTVGAGDFNFTIDPATKVYDGTKKVKYNGTDDARGYFTNSTVTLNRGTAYEKTVPLNTDDITLAKAEYNSPNVTEANRVDYTINVNTQNFDVSGGGHSIVKQEHTAGTITPLDLTTQLPKYLHKEYDTEQDFTDSNKNFTAALAREGLQHGLVKRSAADGGDDEDYLDYTVKGHYHTPDATIKDESVAKANAEKVKKGESITAGTKVDYELSFKAKNFSSDPAKAAEAAKRAQNYTIFGTHATAGEAKNRAADIYRKTLKIDLGRADKQYDGTDRVGTRSAADVLSLTGFAGTEHFTLTDAAAGKIAGRYDSADVSRDADGNVLDKKIHYTNFDEALRTQGGAAKNYRIDDVDYQVGDHKGAILPRKITAGQIAADFTRAEKEYDGTKAVVHKSGDVKQYLSGAHADVTLEDGTHRTFALDRDRISIRTAEYDSENVRGGSQPRVTYQLGYDNTKGNFELTDPANFRKQAEGIITPRKIYADVQGFRPTKTYNKSEGIVGEAYNGTNHPITDAELQNHASYRHYVRTDAGHRYDDDLYAAKDRGKLQTDVKAVFEDANVAWQDGRWRNERQGDAKNVKYTFSLSGDAAAENYELVDREGNALSGQTMAGTTRSAQMMRADGRIAPYRIELRAESREIGANEVVPSEFSGTPVGQDYHTPLGERLSGTISYRAPGARQYWGDYPIHGYYRPASENETVHKNYFFESVPGILHVKFYAPEREYYNTLTQMSKMLPDEYAYENASLDRRSHFGRDAEAEIAYMPPSINMVKDGRDLSKTDIHVTDESVFSLVSEVFG